MNTIKEKSISLRLSGYSYGEINKILNVPKSTLSNWLGDIVMKDELKERINKKLGQNFTKRNKDQTILAKIRANDIQNNGRKEISDLSDNDLRIIGVVLYWAEGYKKLKIINGKERMAHSISFTNSDPNMLSAFILFLEKTMKIDKEKITVDIRIFPGMNAQDEIKYWSKTLNLSIFQFYKPSIVISKSSKGKRPFNRLPHGTIQLRVADTKEFHRLMGMIDGIRQGLDVFNTKS